MKTALLLIEIQNDYFPCGKMPIANSTYVASNAYKILQAYRARQWPVIHIQQLATRPNDTYFLPCTQGAEFYPDLSPQVSELAFKKYYPNSFRDTNLANVLKKLAVEHLTVCGMLTQQSIDATVRAAYDLGFLCTLLRDACTASNLIFDNNLIHADVVQNAFLAALAPTYAAILATDHFVHMLSNVGIPAAPDLLNNTVVV